MSKHKSAPIDGRRLKLLIYSHAFAPEIGGVETIVTTLARGLAMPPGGSDFDVTVATPTAGGDCDDSSFPFAIVRRPGFRKLAELIRESDVVHVAGPALPPMLLAWWLKKPWAVEHHGFQVICPNGQLVQKPNETACSGHFMAGNHRECIRCNSGEGWFTSARLWLLTFVRRAIAKNACMNILPTEWLGTELKLPRMRTIHHGLPAGTEPKNATPATFPTFFFLGRLVPTKGVQILVDAARKLKDRKLQFRVRIAGGGPERDLISARVDAAGLSDRTEFLGSISAAQTVEEFEGATVTVMPSIGGEVFGLVALESMASGCPVVASDIGALQEVIGDAGVTFPIADSTALADRLERIICEPSFAIALRRKSRERAIQVFPEERMIAEHRHAFQDLARGAAS
jgi:glycogen synthase